MLRFIVILTFLSINSVHSQTFFDKEVLFNSESLNYTVTNYGKIESRLMSAKMKQNLSGSKDIVYNAALWVGVISGNNDTLVTSGEGNQTTSCSEWHTLENSEISMFQSDSNTYHTLCSYNDIITLESHQPIGLSVIQTTNHGEMYRE